MADIAGAADVTAEIWDANDLAAPSRDNAAMADYWDQVAAIVAGIKAVRAGGEAYLPKFPDENKEDYDFRLKSTKFTNIYRDIVEGLSSKPFEEPIKLKDGAPGPIKEFCDDVDGSGNNLTVFAVSLFFNAINMSIDWLWIDHTKPVSLGLNRPASIAEERQAGARPIWSRIWAKDMLEIQTALISGEKVFTYARILEHGSAKPRVRIFQRFDKIVSWSLWEKQLNKAVGKEQWLRIESGPITIGIIPLVPLIIGRRIGESWRFSPPMQDAADLQIELYQAESGLKHIRTLAGFPMLSGNGIEPPKKVGGNEPKKLRIGPKTVLYGPPNPGGGAPGNWAYVEPGAQTMTFLAADIKETIAQLRELGRQPLTSQMGGITTITAGVAASKANNAVAMWAFQLADTLENGLEITGLWLNVGAYDAEVTVHTDFDIVGNSEDMTVIQAMREKGDLSRPSLWKEAKRRNVLAPDFDPDEETKLVDAEALANATLLTGEGDPNNPDLLPPNKNPPPVPGKKPTGKPAPAPAVN